MSVSSQLSEKNLTCKLTVLLAWSSALRASSIQHLNINFMAKTKSCSKFYFNNLHNSWRNGKALPAVTYQEYTHNENLCVARTLDEYIAWIERWSSGEQLSQFLLSFIHSHKPVVSSTISGWLKLSSWNQVLILVPLRLVQPDLHQPLKQVHKVLP